MDRLTDCQTTLSTLLTDIATSQRKTQTYTAALFGAPNAGKSSLLNALAQEDVAIVTHLPGTTRDTLKQSINVGALTLQIIDTAGIRDTQDVIEKEGVKRALDSVSLADIVIHVIDDADNTTGHDIPLESNGSLVIRVLNKIDQSGRPPGINHTQDRVLQIGVSAKTGEGLSILTASIEEMLIGEGHQNSEYSARQRHVEALDAANEKLTEALSAYNVHNAAELLAEDLKRVQTSLDTLTGKVSSDDILGQIFSSFCIGK